MASKRGQPVKLSPVPASGGMPAAQAAAKEPFAAAQSAGNSERTEASNVNAAALSARVVRESPLPAVPSGIRPEGQAYADGQLGDEFDSIRKYLNVLYPFTTPDPEDGYWQRRSQVVDATGNVPGVGKAIVPPEYFDYTQRKLNQLVSDEFKNFIFQQIDLTTPASREWWETRFPEYTKEFRQGWKKRLSHAAKMGDMIINGVQSTEDLFYLFITAKGLNPVAYQYQGPPNASQVEQLFNMYQQTMLGDTFPNPSATATPRTGQPPLGIFGYQTGSVMNTYDIPGQQRNPVRN